MNNIFKQKIFDITDISQTKLLAENCAKIVNNGDVILLNGDLGSGKTQFAKFFINYLSDTEQNVTSPTFNIIQEYGYNDKNIYHLDLYRIDNINDLYEIGIEDCFENGISLIEWSEISTSLLPKNQIIIELRLDGEQRTAFVSSKGRFVNS